MNIKANPNQIKEIVEILQTFNAENIRIFDMTGFNSLSQMCIIGAAVSDPQLQAFRTELKHADIFPFLPRIQNTRGSIIADFRAIITVYFISKGMRDYYKFDELWLEYGAKEIILS